MRGSGAAPIWAGSPHGLEAVRAGGDTRGMDPQEIPDLAALDRDLAQASGPVADGVVGALVAEILGRDPMDWS